MEVPNVIRSARCEASAKTAKGSGDGPSGIEPRCVGADDALYEARSVRSDNVQTDIKILHSSARFLKALENWGNHSLELLCGRREVGLLFALVGLRKGTFEFALVAGGDALIDTLPRFALGTIGIDDSC